MSMRAVSLVEAALYLCYIILEIIKPIQFDDGIYSEGALMRTNVKGGAPMKDDQIVNLYWDRNEDAIHQTQMKYGSYLAKVAYNILLTMRTARSVSMIHIWLLGIPCLPIDPMYYPHT